MVHNRAAMPRAKRQRMCRIYNAMLKRIDFDIHESNATRSGALSDLIAARHHIGRIVSILSASL